MKGRVHIRRPVIYDNPEPRNTLKFNEDEGIVRYRPVSGVSCKIDVTREDGSVETRKVWFEVDSKYREGLCDDLCDAYVIGLLHYCLKNHYDISSETPMSEELYYNLTEMLLPALIKNDFRLTDISIECETVPDDQIRRGKYIGTSASCGVDAMFTLHRHADHPSRSLRLTHLCLNNVGSFIGSYGLGDDHASNVAQIYRRSRDLAKEAGLPIVESDSNFSEAFPQNHLFSHLYSSMFAVFMMRYHWRRYFYPSAGHGCATLTFENNSMFDPSRYDLLALYMMSTSKLKLFSDGAAYNRNEKLRDISEYGLARKYLHSCLVLGTNCGRCSKCLRNLFGLDAMGILENFRDVYDLDYYYSNHKRLIIQNLSKKDEFTADSKRIFAKSGSRIYQECLRISEEVDEAISYLKSGEDSEGAIATLEKHKGSSDLALYVLAKHYLSSESKAVRERGMDYLTRGKDNGHPGSVMLYMDYLSNKGDEASRREMIDLCRSYASRGWSRPQFMLAEMLLEGDGMEKDYDAALHWLRLSASRYRPAMSLLHELLTESGDELDMIEARKIEKRMRQFDRRAQAKAASGQPDEPDESRRTGPHDFDLHIRIIKPWLEKLIYDNSRYLVIGGTLLREHPPSVYVRAGEEERVLPILNTAARSIRYQGVSHVPKGAWDATLCLPG